MSTGLHLNLGPGRHPAPPPWLNVEKIHRDTQPLAEVVLKEGQSLTEALTDLYPDGFAVARIMACHVAEHIDQHLLLATFREWFDLLATGGQLGIVGPNFYAALQYWKDDLIDLKTLIQHGEVGDIWTEDRWTEWYQSGELDSFAMHSWMSTPERTIGVMRAAGFIAEHREPTWEGMAGWPITASGGAQLACVGTKP